MKKKEISNFIIYKSKDNKATVEVNLTEETIWLTLNQIAELFDRDKSVISRHINNIYKDRELSKKSTVAKFATVQRKAGGKFQELLNTIILIQ